MTESEQEFQTQKTKEQYSRNVKTLKWHLQKLEGDMNALKAKSNKVDNLVANAHSIDNDRLLAMRFSKLCRVRRFTPEMVYRFADAEGKGEIDQTHWKATLQRLGFNLTPDEILKITLLIDEDLSGKITALEFVDYLEAFNINTQTPMKLAPKGMRETGIRDISRIVGKQKLVDWEQFYKYVKGLFPLMRQKDLIKIFSKLDPQNTGKVSMTQLNNLLNKLLKEEDQQKQKQEKVKQKVPQDSNILSPSKKSILKKISKKQSVQKENPQVETDSLQFKIRALLTNRKWKGRIFHLTQFREAGTKLNRRDEFVKLFKDIDGPKVGSFNYNELIRYCLDHKSAKEPYRLTYDIIKSKLNSENHTIEELLFKHGLRDDSDLTEDKFTGVFREEFDLPENHCKNMFKEMTQQLPPDNRQVKTVNLIHQFKYQKDEGVSRPNPNNLIELNYFNTKPHDFFRKGTGSMVFSPFVALKFCLYLQSKIIEGKKECWMDPDFGITFQDRSGFLSLTGREVVEADFGVDQDDVTWTRCLELGMKDFYDGYQSEYSCGKVQNLQFVSALTMLPEYYQSILWSDIKNGPQVQNLTQKELVKVFSGIYPKAFHTFAKYGIYVFRYFINSRWVYVLVDDYIPTMTSKQPLFSHAKSSWMSLIEKGYAKVEGSYASMLSRQSIYQVIYELSHLAPTDLVVPPVKADVATKDKFWGLLMRVFSTNPDVLVSCFNDKNKSWLQCMGVQTQLQGEESAQIICALQLEDSIIKNQHSSHRLLIVKFNPTKKINDKAWNGSWTKYPSKNKYSLNIEAIEKYLGRKQMSKVLTQLQSPNVMVVNYQKFRSLYDRVYFLEDLDSDKWNAKLTLDRMLKEDGKFTSEFRLQSRMKSEVVLAFVKRVQLPLQVTILFGEVNKRPTIRKTTTEDFCFVKIQLIAANTEYVIYVCCNKEPVDFYLAFHLETKDFSVRKSNGPAKFQDIKKLEEICLEYEDADPKVKEYLEKRLFDLQPKPKPKGCCG